MRRIARALLASRVIRLMRRAGVADARYDSGTFAVRFTRSGDDRPTVAELGGLLADRSGDRRARTEHFVAGFLGTPEVPSRWNDACPLLRPVLRGAPPVATHLSPPLRRPALPYLSEYLVIDGPDTMTYVSPDQLTVWGVDADEAFAAARENLGGAVLQGVATRPTVVRFVDDGDAYWASHLLIDGWLSRLAGQVGGVPVAFAPDRGTLLVTADGSDLLPRLFAGVEEAYAGSPRAISPVAYTSDAHGRTIPYPAPAGHPLHHRVRRAQALLAVTEYAKQSLTHPGMAAPLHLVRSPGMATSQDPAPSQDPAESQDPEASRGVDRSATDGWHTRAVWTGDSACLLPHADEVQIGDRVVPWAELKPHLTAVPGLDPPRWRLRKSHARRFRVR